MSQLLVGGRRGSAWIGAAAVLSALLSLSAQVVFERALGPDGFARWSYLSALCVLLLPLACLGSNHLLMSEHYAGRLSDAESVRRLLALYAACTAIAATVFALLCLQQSLAAQRGMLPVLVALFLLQVPIVLVYPVLQVRGHAGGVGLWPLAPIGLRLAVALAALALAWAFESAVLAWTVGCVGLAAVALGAMHAALRSRLRRPGNGPAKPLGSLIGSAASFGVNDSLDGLDLKLLVPLAAWLLTPLDTAAAGIVVVLLSAAFFAPHVIVSRLLLPAVHRTGGDSDELGTLVRRLCTVSVAVMLPLAALWWWLGPPMLAHVVRGDYGAQAQALRLVGVVMIPMVLSMLGAAPHLSRQRSAALLQWRAEAALGFVVLALLWRDSGLVGLLWAMLVGRSWLCARVLLGRSRAVGAVG